MTGELLALGVSHKTAPLALRERLALPEGRAASTLRELTAHEAVHEAVAISTCNRTELYLVAHEPVEAENEALSILSRQADIRPTELVGSMYSLRGQEAVRHLFSVAAGLESMIVGEAEVQGQVKRAYELALVEDATGPISNRLFRDALGAGKRVRTETGVGRSRVSVSSVAVDLAAGLLGDLSTRRVLVIGAGENGELTARALAELGVHTVFVANRRYDRAIGLAERFGGTAVRFDDLPAELARADIVVSCTSSPHQIFGREELEVVVEERGRRPLVLIDIAVPRDIEPSVRDLCSGVTLFDMDDLQREVARNLSVREAEATKARMLIDEDAERFDRWLGTLDVVPTIAALRDRAEGIVEQVLRENEQRWERLSDADRERVGVMARAIVNRLLHEPTVRLKRGEEVHGHLHALRELFDLEAELREPRPAEVTDIESRRRRRR
ncbi:MAG TPA: glutamyl-tRNA reductase [Thermoleophilaceae bacterium]|nr:glutamyl-tRNA reductase [Thermoleophilaceae bacterium]